MSTSLSRGDVPLSTLSATITEIKRFATHDGPGIRTTLFFKDCPLHCRWCSNPEGIDPRIELAVRPRRCRQHGACAAACPEAALAVDAVAPVAIDRAHCTVCLACVPVCPEAVFRAVGRAVPLPELLREVEKDLPFYGDDGGVTLCGGEPLLQAEAAIALLRACHERGISTVLDTCGHAPPAVVEAALPHLDLVLLDIKHTDPEAHRRATGVDNALILENAARFARGARLRLSLPLVAGFNDSPENLTATARLALQLGAEAVDLLPCHSLGLEKYRELGLELPPRDPHCSPEQSAVREARGTVEACGVQTTIGRMM
jgi:pyruvate formate lyase activating enzyme